MEHVLGKVRIGVSKGAPDIIILVSSRFNEALEFWNYGVIASVALVIDAEPVVDFPSSVEKMCIRDRNEPQLRVININCRAY